MISTILQSVGLDPAETKVYLTCLKLGTQDVTTIANEAGITRPLAQSLLTKLLERGYVSRFRGKKEFYTAESPQVIMSILESQNEERLGKLQELKDRLPELESFANPSTTKPEIAFYEGKDGLIAAWEDTLTSKSDVLAITSIDDTEQRFPKYVPRYYKRRKAAGILIKAIFPDTPMSRERKKRDGEELRETRLVPPDLLDIHIELNIYDDKVAYFAIDEEIAIIVKSKVIAEGMRSVFALCWRMADICDSAPPVELPKKKSA